MKENNQKILRERRKKIESEKENLDLKNLSEIVVFHLNLETYGIESKYVREAISIKDITTLPQVPEFIAGVINYRRKVLSVVDLKKIFGISHIDKTTSSKILVLEDQNMEFGLMVDSIENVQWIALNELQTNLATLSGVYEKYFMGLSAKNIILLNGKKILSDSDFIIDVSKG